MQQQQQQHRSDHVIIGRVKQVGLKNVSDGLLCQMLKVTGFLGIIHIMCELFSYGDRPRRR